MALGDRAVRELREPAQTIGVPVGDYDGEQRVLVHQQQPTLASEDHDVRAGLVRRSVDVGDLGGLLQATRSLPVARTITNGPHPTGAEMTAYAPSRRKIAT